MAGPLMTAQELFLIDSQTFDRVLARGPDGFPEPVDPQPLLLRAFYLSPHEDLEARMPAVRLSLAQQMPDTLLCLFPCPDGPPFRLARVFKFSPGAGPNKYKDRFSHLRSAHLYTYRAVMTGSYAWDTDLSQNRYGVFATGEGPGSLYRLFRADLDALRGPIFTLAPLQLASGFPQLDLSTIPDPLRQKEITSQYEELQRCVNNHAYRGVISRAKDMAEALIPLRADLKPEKSFAHTLKTLADQITEAQTSGVKPPVPPLVYHLAEKLRFLHQRTHPERTINVGRPISPEFALTVVEDLIEILRELGFAKT